MKKEDFPIEIYNKLKGIKPEDYSIDDIFTAELFIKLYGDRCRYVSDLGVWYAFDGKRWVVDNKAVITRKYFKQFQRLLCLYAAKDIEDDTKRTVFLENIRRYAFTKNINYALSYAESCDPFTVDMFDRNTDLFNCQNGTLNLKTFEFKDHDPADHLTQIANCVYDPNASKELFDKTVNEICENNEAKKAYLQRMSGYSLTAEAHLECCFIAYGATTRNGKSTFLETINYMMGDYSDTLDPASLSYDNSAKKRGSSAAPDIYKLKNKRFVIVREPERRLPLASSFIKTVTGRDKISARKLYSNNEIQFQPYCKLWFNTNWKPLINDVTLFTSDRVRIVPFNRHFKESERNKNLKDELLKPENLSGVFNWCLEGLKDFRKKGEAVPAEIKQLIKEYEKEENSVSCFIDEKMECRIDSHSNKPYNSTPLSVFTEYGKWCTANNKSPYGKQRFYDELRAKGLLRDGNVNGHHYKEVVYGLVLKS